jgi:hypothetical protein
MDMDTVVVKTKLIDVLTMIQRDSGFSAVPITGATCPLDDLEGFDTKIVPTAIDFLAAALGIDIPLGRNIFVSFDGSRRLTIDQVVAGLCAGAPIGG